MAAALLVLGTVLVLLEGMSWLALRLRPTGNPLARPAAEAALHFYLPSDDWLFYRVKPNHVQRFRSDEFDTHIRTNSFGFRENADTSGPVDIGVVGDTFAFGHGVEVGERHTDHLRNARVGSNVWSYGLANGYAPPHYLLFLRNNPQFVPRRLVIELFPWNDLSLNMSDMVVERDVSGQMVAIRSSLARVRPDGFWSKRDAPGDREPWWRSQAREFNLGRVALLAYSRLSRLAQARQHADAGPNAEAGQSAAPSSIHRPVDFGQFDQQAETSLDAVREIAELVRLRGGDAVVFYIPTSYMVGDYPYFCETLDGYTASDCARFREANLLGDALRVWAERNCLWLIDPVAEFRRRESAGTRLYFAKDGQWTVAGHRAAADLLLQHPLLQASESALPPRCPAS